MQGGSRDERLQPERGEGEASDVVGKDVDVIGGVFLGTDELADDRLVDVVKETLSDDAEADHVAVRLFAVSGRYLGDDFAEDFGHGADVIMNNLDAGGGGMNHFAHGEAEVPSGSSLGEQAAQKRTDKVAELGFGRSCIRPGRHGSEFLAGAIRVADGLEIELLLVAKVVVDGGDVGPGGLADLSYGGGLETFFGKGITSGIQQS